MHASRIVSALAALGLCAVAVAPAAADGNTATVAINDSGYNPASISVPLNGTVVFTDSGANVHTATSMGGVQTPFDTGGLAPGQTYSVTFSIPGTYQFTSATD